MGRDAPTRRSRATFGRSFGHARDGIVAAAAERNMRIHLVAGSLAGSFAAFAPLTAVERAVIVLCAAAVIAAEAVNTAIEALVDLHGAQPSAPGRLAKDAAAGAVMILVVGSVLAFGIIAAGRWSALVEARRALALPALVAIGVGLVTALLLAGAAPLRRAARPLWAVGAVGVAWLAVRAASPACALLPAAVLLIAAGAARERRPASLGS